MPPLFSFYVFLALSFSAGGPSFFLIIAVIFASIIQSISVLSYGRISKNDVNVEDREYRPALFAIAIFAYLLGYAALRSLSAPFIFNGLMLAYVCNTAVAAVIAKYMTKVSIHTWGIAGPSVAILYSFGPVPFILVLAIGLVVGATRVKLGYHNWPQVALPFLISVPFTWLILYTVPFGFPALFRS